MVLGEIGRVSMATRRPDKQREGEWQKEEGHCFTSREGTTIGEGK